MWISSFTNPESSGSGVLEEAGLFLSKIYIVLVHTMIPGLSPRTSISFSILTMITTRKISWHYTKKEKRSSGMLSTGSIGLWNLILIIRPKFPINSSLFTACPFGKRWMPKTRQRGEIIFRPGIIRNFCMVSRAR